MQEKNVTFSQEVPNVPGKDDPSRLPGFKGSTLETSDRPHLITRGLALLGFSLYSIFAPHSIAGAEISLGFVGIALVVQVVTFRTLNLKRTKVDLPIVLFVLWTILSSLLSIEPGIAIRKLQSVCVVFLLYLVRSFVSRKQVIFLVVLMVLSSAAGTFWSVIDLARGRGIVIESISPDSPFRKTDLQLGDAIWRFNGRRVRYVGEIDEIIRNSGSGAALSVDVIRDGESTRFPGFVATREEQLRTQPSGLFGTKPTHKFRASGWTRHYETFCETLQVVAQLALGLALAFFIRRKKGATGKLSLLGSIVVAIGIALTAMRTAIVAFLIGAGFMLWRSRDTRIRRIGVAALLLVVIAGGFTVWRTRSTGSITFQDDSTNLRREVATVGLQRILVHPFFGVGMDAVHRHWHEWGFPGNVVIHLHSTPLELAFERGIPALLFWIWILLAWFQIAWRAEKVYRESDDYKLHGFLLGALGAIVGFTSSSLVNYNFGDGEVALVFWFLMGLVIVVAQAEPPASEQFQLST